MRVTGQTLSGAPPLARSGSRSPSAGARSSLALVPTVRLSRPSSVDALQLPEMEHDPLAEGAEHEPAYDPTSPGSGVSMPRSCAGTAPRPQVAGNVARRLPSEVVLSDSRAQRCDVAQRGRELPAEPRTAGRSLSLVPAASGTERKTDGAGDCEAAPYALNDVASGRWLDTNEAAAYMHLCTKSVRRMVFENRLRAERIGRNGRWLRFKIAWLDEAMTRWRRA